MEVTFSLLVFLWGWQSDRMEHRTMATITSKEQWQAIAF